MSESLLQQEGAVRLIAFFGTLLAMVLWEVVAPRRRLSQPRGRRWPSNLGIVALNTILLRLIFPGAALGGAWLAHRQGVGLFNMFDLPPVVAVIAAVVVLDFTIYLQHRLFHAVPILWRLHRMHHADLDIDVTTGARFHPVEILLSLLIKLAVVIALGAPPLSVLLFEVLLNATAMFNHGNVRLAAGLDRWLRLLVVTPDMHRVHHSVVLAETNSNFGFNLPWWDGLLGSYQAQPAAGHEAMRIGLEVFREPSELRLDRMLLQPFRETGESRTAAPESTP
jgi:sterol desaturase/sphingolipid hydroxylase (fatty acid hydroxylase superfamily)